MWYKKGYGDDQGWYAPGGTGSNPVLTYIGDVVGSHSGAVETYTNANIGSAAGFTTRRIICVLTSNSLTGPSSISGITFNGSAGTIHVQQNNSGQFCAIFSANVATGSTATIAVTYNSSVFNDQFLDIYTVDDATLLSTTPSVGQNTAASATSISTSSFTQTTGGFTVAGAGFSTNVGSLAITGYSTNHGGGTSNVITGNLTGISSTGSVTATATWTTSANAAIAAASWR